MRKMLRVNQKYAQRHAGREWPARRRSRDAPQIERVAEKPERTAAPGSLALREMSGLIYTCPSTGRMLSVGRGKPFDQYKVAPRAVDDPLRPAQVNFGTMNVSTPIRRC